MHWMSPFAYYSVGTEAEDVCAYIQKLMQKSFESRIKKWINSTNIDKVWQYFCSESQSKYFKYFKRDNSTK